MQFANRFSEQLIPTPHSRAFVVDDGLLLARSDTSGPKGATRAIVLNATGRAIYEACANGIGFEQLVAQLASSYNVLTTDIASEVATAVDEFLEQGFLTFADA
ncbi:PqqD family protein [Candidatus Marimicrobium litorale]|uniref:PqqD family peptide modification chaperone n=1 Tax=Candidatus Marimicrobium litorale TaxID=2518991 RepID=A0ABT3T4T1_9GAMM|nr:PqqD family protein [Candidatus Marimicrobium litorale]MCX2977074.1 PqqD family peptide modification chaperone [Candidatus Marimicrobium litorale]